MSFNLRDNGDLVVNRSNGQPLAKFQAVETFLAVQVGPHVLDVDSTSLDRADIEAIRDWCDRELGGRSVHDG